MHGAVCWVVVVQRIGRKLFGELFLRNSRLLKEEAMPGNNCRNAALPLVGQNHRTSVQSACVNPRLSYNVFGLLVLESQKPHGEQTKPKFRPRPQKTISELPESARLAQMIAVRRTPRAVAQGATATSGGCGDGERLVTTLPKQLGFRMVLTGSPQFEWSRLWIICGGWEKRPGLRNWSRLRLW